MQSPTPQLNATAPAAPSVNVVPTPPTAPHFMQSTKSSLDKQIENADRQKRNSGVFGGHSRAMSFQELLRQSQVRIDKHKQFHSPADEGKDDYRGDSVEMKHPELTKKVSSNTMPSSLDSSEAPIRVLYPEIKFPPIPNAFTPTQSAPEPMAEPAPVELPQLAPHPPAGPKPIIIVKPSLSPAKSTTATITTATTAPKVYRIQRRGSGPLPSPPHLPAIEAIEREGEKALQEVEQLLDGSTKKNETEAAELLELRKKAEERMVEAAMSEDKPANQNMDLANPIAPINETLNRIMQYIQSSTTFTDPNDPNNFRTLPRDFHNMAAAADTMHLRVDPKEPETPSELELNQAAHLAIPGQSSVKRHACAPPVSPNSPLNSTPGLVEQARLDLALAVAENTHRLALDIEKSKFDKERLKWEAERAQLLQQAEFRALLATEKRNHPSAQAQSEEDKAQLLAQAEQFELHKAEFERMRKSMEETFQTEKERLQRAKADLMASTTQSDVSRSNAIERLQTLQIQCQQSLEQQQQIQQLQMQLQLQQQQQKETQQQRPQEPFQIVIHNIMPPQPQPPVQAAPLPPPAVEPPVVAAPPPPAPAPAAPVVVLPQSPPLQTPAPPLSMASGMLITPGTSDSESGSNRLNHNVNDYITRRKEKRRERTKSMTIKSKPEKSSTRSHSRRNSIDMVGGVTTTPLEIGNILHSTRNDAAQDDMVNPPKLHHRNSSRSLLERWTPNEFHAERPLKLYPTQADVDGLTPGDQQKLMNEVLKDQMYENWYQNFLNPQNATAPSHNHKRTPSLSRESSLSSLGTDTARSKTGSMQTDAPVVINSPPLYLYLHLSLIDMHRVSFLQQCRPCIEIYSVRSSVFQLLYETSVAPEPCLEFHPPPILLRLDQVCHGQLERDIVIRVTHEPKSDHEAAAGGPNTRVLMGEHWTNLFELQREANGANFPLLRSREKDQRNGKPPKQKGTLVLQHMEMLVRSTHGFLNAASMPNTSIHTLGRETMCLVHFQVSCSHLQLLLNQASHRRRASMNALSVELNSLEAAKKARLVPKLEFYPQQNDGSWSATPIITTEPLVIESKNSLSVHKWAPIQLPLFELCAGNIHRSVLVKVYREQIVGRTFLTSFQFQLSEILGKKEPSVVMLDPHFSALPANIDAATPSLNFSSKVSGDEKLRRRHSFSSMQTLNAGAPIFAAPQIIFERAHIYSALQDLPKLASTVPYRIPPPSKVIFANGLHRILSDQEKRRSRSAQKLELFHTHLDLLFNMSLSSKGAKNIDVLSPATTQPGTNFSSPVIRQPPMSNPSSGLMSMRSNPPTSGRTHSALRTDSVTPSASDSSLEVEEKRSQPSLQILVN